jgi:hypothetical protein
MKGDLLEEPFYFVMSASKAQLPGGGFESFDERRCVFREKGCKIGQSFEPLRTSTHLTL